MKNAMIACVLWFIFFGVVTSAALNSSRVEDVPPPLSADESVSEEDVVSSDEKVVGPLVEPEVVIYPDELLVSSEKTEDAEKKASEKAVPPRVERKAAVITYRLPKVITSVSCGGPRIVLPKKRRFSEEGILEEVPPEEIEREKRTMMFEHGMPEVISRVTYPDGKIIPLEKPEPPQEEK